MRGSFVLITKNRNKTTLTRVRTLRENLPCRAICHITSDASAVVSSSSLPTLRQLRQHPLHLPCPCSPILVEQRKHLWPHAHSVHSPTNDTRGQVKIDHDGATMGITLLLRYIVINPRLRGLYVRIDSIWAMTLFHTLSPLMRTVSEEGIGTSGDGIGISFFGRNWAFVSAFSAYPRRWSSSLYDTPNPVRFRQHATPCLRFLDTERERSPSIVVLLDSFSIKPNGDG